MAKKILLVNPTRTGTDSFSMPPLHLMYLKKAIEDNQDWTCEIFDVNHEINKSIKLVSNIQDEVILKEKAKFEDEVIAAILKKEFDILGIGGIVPCYPFSERLVDRIAAIKPDTWVIIGGGLGLPLKDLWGKHKVDFIAESDSEITLADIIKAYPDRERTKQVRGLYHFDGNGWKGSPPELPSNLDYIAYPNWEDIDYEYFMDILRRWTVNVLPGRMNKELKNVRLLPVVMTRGCPYSCTFCFHFNRYHRKHSIEYILSYLEHLKKKYDINMIQTWDDLIITDKKWFIQLCEALKKKGLGLKIFMSGGKPNLIDSDMARMMKEAGVTRISFGIESGSPLILKEMKKMATVEENRRAVKLTMGNGIFTHLNMVVGMPSESSRTLKETRKFILDLQKETDIGSENVSFSCATAYPGTELFEYALKKGMVTDVRKYVMENKGVGSYSLDFCGLGEKKLKRFIDMTLIRMDLRDMLKHPNAHRTYKLILIRIPKFIVRFFFPRQFVVMIKRFMVRREYRFTANPKTQK